MNRTLILALCVLSAATAFAAEMHTWTDGFGRTIKGEFVEANPTDIIVKRDDGKTVKIPRTLLTEEDVIYADKAQSSKHITVILDVNRGKFSANKAETSSEIITMEQWGYTVTLTNKSSFVGHDLRVDYQLYLRKAAGPGMSISTQPLIHRGASETIEKIDVLGKTEFRTTTIPAKKVELQPDWVWDVTDSNESLNDKLEGIWVRVFQGDTMINEYLSREEFRKEGWPATAPTPAPVLSGGGRRGSGSPPPSP